MRRILLASLCALALLSPTSATASAVGVNPPNPAPASEPDKQAAPEAMPNRDNPRQPAKLDASTSEGATGGSEARPTETKAETKAPKRKPVAPTLIAHVDLTRQSMKVTINGKTAHTWKISSGVKGYETPVGRFKPSWKAEMWNSRTYDNAPMPHSVFFKDGAAIHGTSSTAYLGRPASHGCVRLSAGNARIFYRLLGKHGFERTRIVVTGKAPAVGFPRSRTARNADPYYISGNVRTQRLRVQPRPAQNWYYPSNNRRFVYPGTRTPTYHRPYWSR